MASSMKKPLALVMVVLTIQIMSTSINCQKSYGEILKPPVNASEDSPAKLYSDIGAVCSLLESIVKLDNLSNNMEASRSEQLRAISLMGTHIQSNMCNWANLKLNEELQDENGVCAVDKLLKLCLQVRAYNIAIDSPKQ